MTQISEALSRFAAELTYDHLPHEAVEATELFIADYYAACFAGHRVNGAFNRAVEAVLLEMGGAAQASVLFSDARIPAANAAFMNAVYAHGADMDDGNRKAMGHIGAHVMSAVFALAETLPVTGREVFAAINVGYEVYNRVSAAAQPGLVRRGFHSTGTAGAIACGAACAKLMRMDTRGIYNTLSLCAIQASGLILIAESGQACKPINPANAAKTGILSAGIVSHGVESSRYPLESKKGWFHAMSDEIDERMVTDGLGETFTICESYIKPYPSCRHTHGSIDAALRLRARLKADGKELCAENIRAVRIRLYDNAIQIAGQIRVPQTPEDAKFSIHYAFATALLRGHFDLRDLATASMPPEMVSVIEKTELVADAAMEDRQKGIRGAHAELIWNDGKVYRAEVLIPKGDAENPFSWEDMAQKMTACMDGYYDRAAVDDMIANIKRLRDLARFDSIKAVLKWGISK